MGSGVSYQPGSALAHDKYEVSDDFVIPLKDLTKKLRAFQHCTSGEILILIDAHTNDLDFIKEKGDWMEAAINHNLQQQHLESLKVKLGLPEANVESERGSSDHSSSSPQKSVRSRSMPLNMNANKDVAMELLRDMARGTTGAIPQLQGENPSSTMTPAGDPPVAPTAPTKSTQQSLQCYPGFYKRFSHLVNNVDSSVSSAVQATSVHVPVAPDSPESKMKSSEDYEVSEEKSKRVGVNHVCKICNEIIPGGSNQDTMEEHIKKCMKMSQLKHQFDEINLKLRDMKIDLSQRNYMTLRGYLVKAFKYLESKVYLNNAILKIVKKILDLKHTDLDTKFLESFNDDIESMKVELETSLKEMNDENQYDCPIDGESNVAIQKALKEDTEKFYNYLDMAQQQLKIKRDLLRLNHRYYLSAADFTFIKYLSQGAYSKVHLAVRHLDKRQFAIKVIEKAVIREKKMSSQLFTELKVLTRTSVYPDYFAKFSLSFQTNQYLFLSMEVLTGGDCLNFLIHNKKFPEEIARYIIAEVCLGIKTLHYHGVVHRDIKPDNIMISGNGHVKIVDFGHCCFIEREANASVRVNMSGSTISDLHGNTTSPSESTDDDRGITSANYKKLKNSASTRGDPLERSWNDESIHINNPNSVLNPSSSNSLSISHPDSSSNSLFIATRGFERTVVNENSPLKAGAVRYCSPELVSGAHIEKQETIDWWALGVLLFHFLAGHTSTPFEAETDDVIMDNIRRQNVNWSLLPKTVSKSARIFINDILCKTMPQRIGTFNAEQVLDHPYFSTDLELPCGTVGKLIIDKRLYEKEGPLIIDSKNLLKYFSGDDRPPPPDFLEDAEKFTTSDEFDWFTTNNL